MIDGPPDKGRAAFLSDPLAYDGEGVPPSEWLVAGWQSEAFRDDVVYRLARSVGKLGGFGLAGEWLSWLSGVLTPAQVAELYERIRDESERLELEWRPEFEAAFPQAQLPEARDAEHVLGALREMIEAGDGQGFEHLVETLLKLPVVATALDPVAPGSLVEMARAHGRGVMLSILEDARQSLVSGRARDGA